jgi:hypothetical protein
LSIDPEWYTGADMLNKKALPSVLVFIIFASVVAGSGCKSSKVYNPNFIINVTLDEVTYPVDKDHRLYAVFYVNPDFDLPWMTLNSSWSQIITPPLNIGDYPLYFEVWYDADGDGLPTTGVDFYQGWKGKIARTTDTIDPLPVTDTEIMMLTIDLNNNAFF